MRCLNSALTIDGSLSADEVKKRTIMFAFCLVSVSTSLLVSLLQEQSDMQTKMVFKIGYCIVVTAGCVSIVKVLCKQQLHTTFVVGYMYFIGIGICLWDLDTRTFGYFAWPMLILVVDMLLVMEVPSRYSAWFVGATVVWLFLMGCEESFRFGLFDLPGLFPYEGEHSRRALILEKADCEFLPCKTPFPPLGLFPTMFVFLIDFFVTRRFAHNVLKEQESMRRTISVVQEIASLLAGYDVEQVAEMLDVHGGDLPEGMTAALWRLEKNLRMYKAYLPKTCLPFQDEVDRMYSESDGGEFTDSRYIHRVLTFESIKHANVPATGSVLGEGNPADTEREGHPAFAGDGQCDPLLLLHHSSPEDPAGNRDKTWDGGRVHRGQDPLFVQRLEAVCDTCHICTARSKPASEGCEQLL